MSIFSIVATGSWRFRRLATAALLLAFLLYLLLATHGDIRPHLVWSSEGGLSATTSDDEIDWSNFAYVQYATTSDCLCNSVMIFETLDRLGTRADKVLMYPSAMIPGDLDEDKSHNALLLKRARDEYNVYLQPIQIQHKDVQNAYWEDSFTKLLVFNQTDYKRVLHLDSDATILKLMDELFLLPPCPVAMPRAYWLYPDDPKLASPVILVQPSTIEFERIAAEITKAGSNDYDMEVVNTLYKDQAMVIPHRPYLMLTRELWAIPEAHAGYLGTDKEKWDPVAAFHEVKYVHFSDGPMRKPWENITDEVRAEFQPGCQKYNGFEVCKEREIWNWLHIDFTERRKHVCKSFDTPALRP